MKWGSKPIWLACQSVWMFVCNDQALWQEVQVKWQEIWWGKGIKALQYRFWKLFLQKSIMISSEKFVPIQSTYWERSLGRCNTKFQEFLYCTWHTAHFLFSLLTSSVAEGGFLTGFFPASLWSSSTAFCRCLYTYAVLSSLPGSTCCFYMLSESIAYCCSCLSCCCCYGLSCSGCNVANEATASVFVWTKNYAEFVILATNQKLPYTSTFYHLPLPTTHASLIVHSKIRYRM